MRTLIFTFLVFISSCIETKKTTKDKKTEKIITDFKLSESDFVILSYQSDWNWIFENAKPTELVEKDLIEMEKILKVAINENNELQKINLIRHNKEHPNNKLKETGLELKLKGNKRQYVPVINDRGEKKVWVNIFCDDLGSERWKSEIVTVLDGGNCYFNLKVNLTNKTYSEISINGYS